MPLEDFGYNAPVPNIGAIVRNYREFIQKVEEIKKENRSIYILFLFLLGANSLTFILLTIILMISIL